MEEKTKQLNNIRNFVIIAHIDHGKSTLADRMLELTGTIEKRKMREQVLDQMELERERGITIKLQPVRMSHILNSNSYILNLIDTPGHIDFSYEVSRSLRAVEGAVLLVDATQGVQAQTFSNLEMAKELGLKIIPVLNKIDLPNARIEETEKEIIQLVGCKPDEILKVSAKTGQGVSELLEAIIERIPPPLEVQPLPQAPASPELQRGEQHEVEPLNMGKVYAMERVPELCDFGRSNITKYNFIEKNIVECFCQDASDGLPKTAKKINGFDKIIAAAELEKIPEAWKKQLKIGGRIVAPIKNSIGLFVKKSPKDFEMKEYPGFAFVPFIKE